MAKGLSPNIAVMFRDFQWSRPRIAMAAQSVAVGWHWTARAFPARLPQIILGMPDARSELFQGL
jgi:hypothetical protein